MAGVFRLISGFVIAAGFIVAWLAITWLVMLAALYLVRAIPLTTRRRRPEPEKDRANS
jgi:ABC-type Fe3+ transport system permease subunit